MAAQTKSGKLRGADVVARALAAGGVQNIFTLSGNHIMPVFDGLLDTGAHLYHVRHEAAAVHMADAWGRITGEVGIALATGGPGHANAVGALMTAHASDSPMVLLSGHAPLDELGLGSFQELRQADMAAPVTKAAWTAQSLAGIGHDIARAMQLARSGRPGPVHVSLPTDLLDGELDDAAGLVPAASAFAPVRQAVSADTARGLLGVIDVAKRPVIVAGPMMCTPSGRALLRELEAKLGVPAVGMESPRGLNEPVLGAFAELLKETDLVVLLGKHLDFTLRFGRAPVVAANSRFAAIDPDGATLDRASRAVPGRLDFAGLGDAHAAARALIAAAGERQPRHDGWFRDATHAITHRPEAWASAKAGRADVVHPAAFGYAIKAAVERHPETIFISDGGEIGQWAQAIVPARRRVTNGVAGSIGASIPFALAARVAEKSAPVVTVMGDGTFGFHMAEFDTAVRHALPFVAVVGNDARWNAEHQIQLRDYGAERTIGCELLPTRYDQVVEALGGFGALVTRAEDLEPAIANAIASGKPACVNVMIDGLPAPVIRRT